MKVIFPYCDHGEHAFGSPAGWDLNVAELFRRRGHEIHFGNGNRGVEEGLKVDLLFVYERLDLWTDERSRKRWASFSQCADKILLGVFDPINVTHLASVPENCLLVTPFRSLETECLVLPYAHYDTKPEPNFDKKTIGWTIRNPFAFPKGSVPSDHPGHLAHLQACSKLVEEGHKLILFSNNTYPTNREGFPPLVNEAHALLDGLLTNDLVTVADHLPYSEYLALLNETSVVLPLTGIGSTTEALKLGAVPLAWENVVSIYSSFPHPKKYQSLTYADIYGKLSKLLTDEQFYKAEYQRLFDLAGVYDSETALKMLDGVLNRL